MGVADSGTESPLATSSCEANAAFVVSSTLFELFFTHVSLPLLLLVIWVFSHNEKTREVIDPEKLAKQTLYQLNTKAVTVGW